MPHYTRNESRQPDHSKRWTADYAGWWHKEPKQRQGYEHRQSHTQVDAYKQNGKGWGAYIVCCGHKADGQKCGWSVSLRLQFTHVDGHVPSVP